MKNSVTTIYKKDKWNMMRVEQKGSKYILQEISDQWGEETTEFLSKAALMQWVQARFAPERYEGPEPERIEILQQFQQI